MQLNDIQNLALLARLDMSEEEMMSLAKDFDSILAYVGQVQEVSETSNNDEADYLLNNVMRDDIATNIPGSYTDDISKQMPNSQDGFLKVKQIL